MKTKFSAVALVTTLIAILLAASCTQANAGHSPDPVTPVVIDTGGAGSGELDPVTLEYNDQHPMPTRIREISDPAATKSAMLRQIRYGILKISGAFTSADGNGTELYVTGTPQEMVDTMSKHIFNIVFSDPTAVVYVAVELRDNTNSITLLQSFNAVYPTPTEGGGYHIKQELQLTLNHGSYIDMPYGVTEVTFSRIDEWGNVSSEDTYAFNNKVYFPFRTYAGNRGRVTLTRYEPTSSGPSRRVVYAYDTETGLPVTTFDGQYKSSIGIQNYREMSDEGLPVVWPGGDIVAMPLDLTVKQNLANQNGYISPQDPMTARIDLSVPRFVVISTGLFNSDGAKTNELLEQPASFLIHTPANGKEIRAFVDESGKATVFLPRGSHDFEIRYRKIEWDGWWPRG